MRVPQMYETIGNLCVTQKYETTTNLCVLRIYETPSSNNFNMFSDYFIHFLPEEIPARSQRSLLTIKKVAALYCQPVTRRSN
jgi:hypothetical protein